VRIVGGRVTTYGRPVTSGGLLASNHVSWLDIPLLGGQTEITFLSKSEVKNWPVIGWLADRAGTLFIERGKRDGAKGASEQIAEHLEQQER
ncbi:lysophospholipid acyltransferase family protein, partial [Escherichia coli]|uniref:lysophospholipid acyltransferase family protein n=1 Tax=Escherichia coli TaxID=562 RepID=UPI0028DF545C